ncbi:right-handed parallel beta-helix repeat-containing protein [Mucilaginibacter sp. KACC 22773]|uniref:right-handed parallel beta-helix repeat-containing protein n=1 Tax=Mucilaginibacter sp. KACC 22773 TaxID=3025671 RepID=UPI00236634A5|nr:right-handed parallel beta-helix repeat-containing protein [Mucilaginibacter sp. KACC 22773]WDF79213.1 right-handed parallel beta-helix repeat-containing protein [Mucilaginibacter sp. KACC 22773]
MKSKSYLIHAIAGMLVVSSFAMCTKNKINGPLSTPSVTNAKFSSLAISDCTYTVQPSEWMVDGTNIPAGSTVCIPAGKRGALLLKNFKGTAAAPIVIINKGGKVTFSTAVTASYGFKTQNCQYFKILGNGDPDTEYGFDINGGNIGMTMDNLSSDFEIANVEVRNSGFAGIMAKTDPSCDETTWRGHFTMQNVILHDNYVHKTGGEGFYVGNSFYANGVSLSCGKVWPGDVVNVKLYKNITDSTGAEGIQVGSAILGCEIYNNTVKTPGISPFASYQNNGIQIGEGTGGKCYNNVIKDAPGNGIIVLGLGDNLVFNNYIINSKAYGIFADSRYTPGPNFQFINNTIIGSALGGIKLNSETIPMNTVINNAIIQSDLVLPIIKKSSYVKLTASNNYVANDVSACQFVNYADDDFHLLSSSPLINAGANVLSYGVEFDYYGTQRPSADAFAIGATEY